MSTVERVLQGYSLVATSTAYSVLRNHRWNVCSRLAWATDSRVVELTEEPQQLSGGELLSAISTKIVALLREHYGRGPMKAKTYVLDDLVVCVLRNGHTAIEQTMMEGGEPERVLQMRRDFQRVMGLRYREIIEELTGRQVVAFLSQTHVDPDITLEVFFVDRPLEGFGAAELIEPIRLEDG
jgi:uncharacterized protein YbcI